MKTSKQVTCEEVIEFLGDEAFQDALSDKDNKKLEDLIKACFEYKESINLFYEE